jgi:hypothetical protein
MAPLAELGQRSAFGPLSVTIGVVYASGARLFGAMSPTQPDQAVLAKAGVVVQAPSSMEITVVADACPVAALQVARRSDREGVRAGADANG